MKMSFGIFVRCVSLVDQIGSARPAILVLKSFFFSLSFLVELASLAFDADTL